MIQNGGCFFEATFSFPSVSLLNTHIAARIHLLCQPRLPCAASSVVLPLLTQICLCLPHSLLCLHQEELQSYYRLLYQQPFDVGVRFFFPFVIISITAL